MTLTAQAPSATAATARARELLDAARAHKRESARHRRLAQAAMQQLAALERDCARLGIPLVIDRPQPGGTGHHG